MCLKARVDKVRKRDRGTRSPIPGPDHPTISATSRKADCLQVYIGAYSLLTKLKCFPRNSFGAQNILNNYIRSKHFLIYLSKQQGWCPGTGSRKSGRRWNIKQLFAEGASVCLSVCPFVSSTGQTAQASQLKISHDTPGHVTTCTAK